MTIDYSLNSKNIRHQGSILYDINNQIINIIFVIAFACMLIFAGVIAFSYEYNIMIKMAIIPLGFLFFTIATVVILVRKIIWVSGFSKNFYSGYVPYRLILNDKGVVLISAMTGTSEFDFYSFNFWVKTRRLLVVMTVSGITFCVPLNMISKEQKTHLVGELEKHIKNKRIRM